MDFQFDATADGRRLKFLNVTDENSRLCLAIRVGRRCKAKVVVAVLEDLTSLYPAPAFIPAYNGPEFIAEALRDWCGGQHHYQHGLHRAGILVGERIRGIVQWQVQG